MNGDIEVRVRRANLVTRDDQLDQLFGEDISRRLLLDVHVQKEGRMTETTPHQHEHLKAVEATQATESTPPRRFRPSVALAVFLGVLAVGLGFALIRSPGSDLATTAPVGIAESYIEASNTWDSEAAVALFAEDAELNGFLAANLAELPAQFDFNRAIGRKWILAECGQTPELTPAEVTCTYSYENEWTRALGVGPYEGSSIRFAITDGLIDELTDNFSSNTGFSDEVWEVFRYWVLVNHPEDASAALYDPSFFIATPNITPKAIVLWEKYTREFVVEQGGS